MIFKDYYKILGLNTNRVTIEEIKIAYKEQAKKYHPDLNGGNRKFEERFKDINEAYKTLSDNTTKRKYDRIWYNNVGRKNKVGRKAPTSNKEALIGMFFGSIKEENSNSLNKNKKGENIETQIDISLEEAFHGVNKTIGLKTTSGKVKSYKIDIPAGVQSNDKIRLAGEGQRSKTGGQNGDLLIKVHIEDSENFKLKENNIYGELLLTPWEATLSRRIKIKTIDGQVTLYIPEGTQSGEIFKLQGKGYPDSLGNRGDLILKTKIVVPSSLTKEEKKYIEELENKIKFNPREV